MDERSASRVVVPDVLPQVVGPGKSLSAAATLEGALTSMTTQVNYQVVLARKGRRAVRAEEGPLSCVSAFVSPQVKLASKAHRTVLAPKGTHQKAGYCTAVVPSNHRSLFFPLRSGCTCSGHPTTHAIKVQ